MSRKKSQKNNLSAPDEFVEEENMILSLSSLWEAFENVESSDDGFDWTSETPIKKYVKRRAGLESVVPKLTIYNGSPDSGESEQEGPASDDFDESELERDENRENIAGVDFEDDEDDSNSLAAGETENIELSPLSILEAMLFVGDKENRALTPLRASDFMRNVSPDEITQLTAVLNERYAAMNCPYEIIQENQGLRLSLKDDFESVRTQFYGRIKEARLNQSAIDVLSIVAYRQPITADEVQKIRKQPSSAVLSQLVRRDLLCLERDSTGKRRVTYYRTTERFLRLFRMESLDELPTAEEIEEKI